MSSSSVDPAIWYWSTFVLMILSIPALSVGFMVNSKIPNVLEILMTVLLSLTLLFYFITPSVRQKTEWIWLLFVLFLDLVSFFLACFRYASEHLFYVSILSSWVVAVITFLAVLVVIVQWINTPSEKTTVVGNNHSATYHKNDGARLHNTSPVVW